MERSRSKSRASLAPAGQCALQRRAASYFGREPAHGVTRIVTADPVGSSAKGGRGALAALCAGAHRARCGPRGAGDAHRRPGPARTLRLLEAYGQLIANTDRHYGNISLLIQNDDWVLSPAPTTCCPCSTRPSVASWWRVTGTPPKPRRPGSGRRQRKMPGCPQGFAPLRLTIEPKSGYSQS